MDDNVVSIYGCESSGAAAPEPRSAALLGMGLLLTSIVYWRQSLK